MIAPWHWLVHVTGCDYGLPYGHFGFYNLYSGFAASYPWVLLIAVPLWWWHRTCHDSSRCLRWGKYPAAGGLFHTCAKHSPDLQGQKPHRELIHRLHREHLERISR